MNRTITGIYSITIENFKGIGAPVTVPLRPITLLFGKNSAGKSTILQAMHYAREILQNRNPDPDKTVIGGDSIDLGGFSKLVHGQDTTKTIRLEFEVELGEFGLEPFPFARDYIEHIYGIDEEGDALSNVRSVTITLETTWEDDRAHIASYAVALDKTPMAKIEVIGSTACITDFNEEHPVFASVGEDEEDTVCRLASEYWFNSASSNGTKDIDGLQSCIPDFSGPLTTLETPLISSSSTSSPSSSSSSSSSSNSMSSRFEEADHAPLFWSFMSRVLVRSGQALLSQLERMRYLGPIRSVPPRGYRPPLTADESRWASGLGAWDAMLRSPEIAERTSECIRDVLGLGYSIRRENRVPLDADGEIMAELRLLGARYDERDAEYYRNRIMEPLERLPRQPALQIHDETNDIDVDPADIGVGVSQVIPVVTGALDTKGAGGPCSIFCVEQPELHVHPAIQVALGDVFIDAIRSSDRAMLIETHSEHLLLRLLRRVRDSLDGNSHIDRDEDPSGGGNGDGSGYGYGSGSGAGAEDGSGYGSGIEPFDLSASDLSVVYVKSTANGVELTPLPVTEDGDFARDWPEGFFEERAEELF